MRERSGLGVCMRVSDGGNTDGGNTDRGNEANGRTRQRKGFGALVTGLSWWQAVLVLAPLALIGIGGAIGGALGGTAAATNAALADAKLSVPGSLRCK